MSPFREGMVDPKEWRKWRYEIEREHDDDRDDEDEAIPDGEDARAVPAAEQSEVEDDVNPTVEAAAAGNDGEVEVGRKETKEKTWRLVMDSDDGIPKVIVQKENRKSIIKICEKLVENEIVREIGVVRFQIEHPRFTPEKMSPLMAEKMAWAVECGYPVHISQQTLKKSKEGVYDLMTRIPKKAEPLPQGLAFFLTDVDEDGNLLHETISPNEFWENARSLRSGESSGEMVQYATDINRGALEDKIDVLDILEGDQHNYLKWLEPTVSGVHNAFFYGGFPGSMFAAHSEDYDLFSANILHTGGVKVWYVVSPADREKTESLVAGILKRKRKCRQFLRHNAMLMDPTWLKDKGVGVTEVVQEVGDMLVIFPHAIHYGFNSGYNLAEAINFASFDQKNVIKEYKPCTRACCPNPVVLTEMSA